MVNLIELTKTDGRLILINIDQIIYIQREDDLGKKIKDQTSWVALTEVTVPVRETYDQILAKLVNSQTVYKF